MIRKLAPVTLGLLVGFLGTLATVSALKEDPMITTKTKPGEKKTSEALRKQEDRHVEPEKSNAVNPISAFDFEAETIRLENRIDDLIRKLAEKYRQRKFETARKLFELIMASETGTGEDMDADMLKLMEDIRDLDHEVFPYFEEKYRDPDTPEKVRIQLVGYILRLGGESTARFLEERLNDPDLNEGERTMIGFMIGTMPKTMNAGDKPPVGGGIRRMPVKNDLVLQLVASPNRYDRSTAAGLLAWDDSPTSIATLQTLMRVDPERSVRRAAIKSLGYRGDRDTLRQFEYMLEVEGVKKDTWAIKKAIAELRKRFPE